MILFWAKLSELNNLFGGFFEKVDEPIQRTEKLGGNVEDFLWDENKKADQNNVNS